jgi:hypothetical protein
VVDAQLGDAARGRRGNDVGRVEPSAQPDLDHAGVGGRPLEGQEGRRRRRLEEAHLHPAGGVERFRQQPGERLIFDQRAG